MTKQEVARKFEAMQRLVVAEKKQLRTTCIAEALEAYKEKSLIMCIEFSGEHRRIVKEF